MATSIAFVSAYVDDFPAARDFYREILQLDEPEQEFPKACLFHMEGGGFWVIGGNKPLQTDFDGVRTSIAFDVDSVDAVHRRLKELGAATLIDEPMQMNEDTWWINFRDPAGNIVEVAGPR